MPSKVDPKKIYADRCGSFETGSKKRDWCEGYANQCIEQHEKGGKAINDSSYSIASASGKTESGLDFYECVQLSGTFTSYGEPKVHKETEEAIEPEGREEEKGEEKPKEESHGAGEEAALEGDEVEKRPVAKDCEDLVPAAEDSDGSKKVFNDGEFCEYEVDGYMYQGKGKACKQAMAFDEAFVSADDSYIPAICHELKMAAIKTRRSGLDRVDDWNFISASGKSVSIMCRGAGCVHMGKARYYNERRLEEMRPALEGRLKVIKSKLKKMKLSPDAQKAAAEKAAAEKVAAEKAAAEKVAAEKVAAEKAAAEKVAAEKVAAKKAAAEKVAAEKVVAEKAAAEKAAAEKTAAENATGIREAAKKAAAERESRRRAEAERAAAELAAARKAAAEKTAVEKVAAKKASAEKVAAEKVAAEKVAAEKAAAEKVAAEKAAAEKVAAEKVAAEKVAAEKVAAEKAAAEKVVAEKVAAEKAAAEKAAAEKVAAEKVAAEKVAAEKAAAEKAAAEKVAPPSEPDGTTIANLPSRRKTYVPSVHGDETGSENTEGFEVADAATSGREPRPGKCEDFIPYPNTSFGLQSERLDDHACQYMIEGVIYAGSGDACAAASSFDASIKKIRDQYERKICAELQAMYKKSQKSNSSRTCVKAYYTMELDGIKIEGRGDSACSHFDRAEKLIAKRDGKLDSLLGQKVQAILGKLKKE